VQKCTFFKACGKENPPEGETVHLITEKLKKNMLFSKSFGILSDIADDILFD